MQRKIDFGQAFGGSLKFGVTGIPTMLRTGWLPLLVLIGGGALLGSAYWRLFGAVIAADVGADPFEMGFGRMALGSLVLLIGGLMFLPVYVALIRKAAGLPKETGGLFGYTFGMRELKVLLAGILNALILGGAALVMLVPIFGLVGYAELGGSGGVLVALGSLVGVAAFALIVWVGVRLSLLVPLVAAEARLSVGMAWTATKGHFWILLALFVVVSVVASIVVQVFQMIGMGIGAAIGARTGGFSPEAIEAAPLAAMGPVLIFSFVFAALGSVYQNLAMTGLAGHVLSDLRGYGDEGVEEVFA